MELKKYLDSTYLKTPSQAGISEEETFKKVQELTQQAMDYGFYAVMIRPEYINNIRRMLDAESSEVKLGTVIAFPEGTVSTKEKLDEAAQAVRDGADELDFVLNYKDYLEGNHANVAKEIQICTGLVLEQGKVIKWIIECAALTEEQMADITKLIRSIAEEKFPNQVGKIFVKSSTGFYKTKDGSPNGATQENISILLNNAGPLPVKAAGGIRTTAEAEEMIKMGVKRIGTSSAKAIVEGEEADDGY